jgi:hypothetical protein
MINPQGGVRPDNWYLVSNAETFTLPDLNTATFEDFERALRQLGTMELIADEPLRAALTAPVSSPLLLATFAKAAIRTAPSDALPGWAGVDVAATPAGGAKVLPDGAVTVYGGGSDLWDTRDEFHYLYRDTTGDFASQSRLAAFINPHPLSKAGWMLRESLAPDAAHVLVHAFADGRITLAWRAERGGLMREQTLAISGLPIGLGLERTGGSVQVRYTDADGIWHRQPLPESVPVPDRALLGLFVLSHDNTLLASATFEGLSAPDKSPLKHSDGGANLLQNASFEVAQDAENAADRAQHWQRWGDWFNREQDWTPRREGRCVLGYHHWQIESGESSGTYQDVTGLKAGTRCTFSVYANRDLAAEGKHGPESVEVRIESRYEGRLLTVASQTYQAKDLASGDGWSRLAVTGTLPADNARVLIVVNPSRQTPRDAAVKFDLVSLCLELSADSPFTTSHSMELQKEERNG